MNFYLIASIFIFLGLSAIWSKTGWPNIFLKLFFFATAIWGIAVSLRVHVILLG